MVRASRSQARHATPQVTRLADLGLDGLGSGVSEEAAPSPVVIHNVVVTANFGCSMDLEQLAWRCYGEYNPRTFRAVKLRITEPRSTALVFSSGRVVCTGGASECAALTALHVFLSVARVVHPEARMRAVTVQNIVASANFGAPVRLEDLGRAFMLRSAFDPELFPGLRLKLRHPKAKVLIFCGGKVVIAGCRNRGDLARAWAAVQIMVSPYLWREGDAGAAPPTHMAMTASAPTPSNTRYTIGYTVRLKSTACPRWRR